MKPKKTKKIHQLAFVCALYRVPNLNVSFSNDFYHLFFAFFFLKLNTCMYVLYQCLNTDRFHKNVSFPGSINVQIDRETITMENER